MGIDNDYYGVYSKLNNFNIILNSLSKKELQPNMKILLNRIKDNKDAIKCDIMNNNIDIIKSIINTTIEEISQIDEEDIIIYDIFRETMVGGNSLLSI